MPYRVDNSAERDPGSFQRIGYHLQLDDEWVFVSMDAFTDDPTKIGIPVDWIHDHQQVRNVNIVSNSPRLEGIAGSTSGIGIVEMWSNCYRTGSSDSIGSVDHSRHLTDYTPGAYDDDDTMSSVDCYGSFQVHTQAGDTVFAYNGWSYSYLPGTVPYDDVGIGNYNGTGVRRSGWGSDWTYAANAPDYEVKRLSVFVNTYPGTFVPQDIQLVDAIADATGQEPARDCESQCGTSDLCDPTSIFATCMPFAEGKLCDSYTQAEVFASGWRAGGIAVNQAGHIIVADIDNERVMRYGPLSLTDRTAPAGESGWHTLVDGLSNIWGLAVCPNGNVYWAERTDIVVNVLECADDVVPTNGVCYSYASTLSTFYDIGNDGFGGMPYHVACGVDNDVAVSTVSSGGVGGNIHYYNSQTDQWMLLQDADVSAHTVGLSFTPAGDLRVIADIDSDSDSDGVNDYRLFLVECQELEPYSPHHGPACAWFGDNRTDYMDADSDNFVSISFHDTDHVHVGDYNWGNVITSADNRVLFGRGTTSNPDALGIMEVVDGELELLEHSDAVTFFHPWDFSVSPTGDVFMSDYRSKNIFRLVCDDPSALLACEEDGALPFPECNHRYQCEPGYGGPMCNEFLYNCDADFCGSAELCGSEMYECNWWLHERYCADYLSLDEFHDNSFEGAPMGIAVNEKSEIFNVQGTALRKYSPETQTWSDIVTTAGEQLWGLTMCPNGNIYYASRSTQKTILEVACLDSETPTDGVCSTYNSSATEFYILTQSSSDDTVANPYHIACGADNDLAVSTVTYGSILHYDAQTETWTDHVSGVDHCVGLSFSPSADLYALCYVDDDGDNYELVKLPCSSKDDVAFGETPSCSAFADDFESVKTLGGDYGWGAMAITRDGHILINRNDGDDTGTLWEFDIVTEEFRAVDYDTSDTDLYVDHQSCLNSAVLCVRVANWLLTPVLQRSVYRQVPPMGHCCWPGRHSVYFGLRCGPHLHDRLWIRRAGLHGGTYQQTPHRCRCAARHFVLGILILELNLYFVCFCDNGAHTTKG